MDRKARWEKIHAIRHSGEGGAGRNPAPSLTLIDHAEVGLGAPILDVGGASSPVVDALLAAGHTNVTVIDVAPSALEAAHKRLGRAAAGVHFIEGDIIETEPPAAYAVWHDRAVFHFLIEEAERQAYLDRVCRHLLPGGHLVLGCFAPEAPDKCCGMAVMRYTPRSLAALLPEGFVAREMIREPHVSPSGKEQPFIYTRFECVSACSI